MHLTERILLLVFYPFLKGEVSQDIDNLLSWDSEL